MHNLRVLAKATVTTGATDQAAVLSELAESVARTISNPHQRRKAMERSTAPGRAAVPPQNSWHGPWPPISPRTNRARVLVARAFVTGRWTTPMAAHAMIERSALTQFAALLITSHRHV